MLARVVNLALVVASVGVYQNALVSADEGTGENALEPVVAEIAARHELALLDQLVDMTDTQDIRVSFDAMQDSIEESLSTGEATVATVESAIQVFLSTADTLHAGFMEDARRAAKANPIDFYEISPYSPVASWEFIYIMLLNALEETGNNALAERIADVNEQIVASFEEGVELEEIVHIVSALEDQSEKMWPGFSDVVVSTGDKMIDSFQDSAIIVTSAPVMSPPEMAPDNEEEHEDTTSSSGSESTSVEETALSAPAEASAETTESSSTEAPAETSVPASTEVLASTSSSSSSPSSPTSTPTSEETSTPTPTSASAALTSPIVVVSVTLSCAVVIFSTVLTL